MWPISGVDMARNTRGCTLLGPGPSSVRGEGFRSSYLLDILWPFLCFTRVEGIQARFVATNAFASGGCTNDPAVSLRIGYTNSQQDELGL